MGVGAVAFDVVPQAQFLSGLGEEAPVLPLDHDGSFWATSSGGCALNCMVPSDTTAQAEHLRVIVRVSKGLPRVLIVAVTTEVAAGTSIGKTDIAVRLESVVRQ